MVRRASEAAFVGGAYVFPGGSVEQVDHRAFHRGLVIGAAEEDGPWRAAALREAGEEAGLWLTSPAAVDPDELEGFPPAEVYERLEQRGLRLDASGIVPLSRWVTPEGPPRRFDTRFYAAEVPQLVPLPDGREVTEALWIEPSDALARYEEGAWSVIVPTIWHLEQLAAHRAPQEVLAEFAQRPPIHVQPELRRDEQGRWRAVLPDGTIARGDVPLSDDLSL